MGGIQAREGSIAEIHAVRGGQLILRVAACQTQLGAASGPAANAASLGGSGSQTANGSGANTPGGGGSGVPGGGGGSGSKLKILIPYNGHCYLLDQSLDVLEKILVRLSPQELAILRLTCRTMNLVVSRYLEHCCEGVGARSNLRRFYERNADLLLPKEVVLRERLEINSNHELLLYSSMKQFQGEVRRVSACDVDRFDSLER